MSLESDLVEIDRIIAAERKHTKLEIVIESSTHTNPYVQIRDVLADHQIAINGSSMTYDDEVTLSIASPSAAETWFNWYEQ